MVVTVGAGAGEGAGVTVADAGCGLDPAAAAHARRYFYTTVVPEEPTYGFSGNFGGQIEGQGVGLPMACAYVHAGGGRVAVAGAPGVGTTVALAYPPQLLPM